jgi:hypothetical protein
MPRRKPSWASGIEPAIKPGAVAPGFMLPDTRGRCVRLQSHVEGTHRVKSIMKLHNFPKLISLSPTSLPQTSFHIAGSQLPSLYCRRLERFQYGSFRIDYALATFGGRHGYPTVCLPSHALNYRRPRSNFYLCGASTLPGGGVHGVPGPGVNTA